MIVEKTFNKQEIFSASWRNDRLYFFKNTDGKVGMAAFIAEPNKTYQFKYNSNFTFEVNING